MAGTDDIVARLNGAIGLERRIGGGWARVHNSLARSLFKEAATALTDRDAQIERLEERCAAYKGQVEAGAAEIERLTRKLDVTIRKIAEELRAEAEARATTAERDLAEARAEVERLRELFRADGEQHAQFVKNLTKAHEDRIKKYAEAFEELRAEVERLDQLLDDAETAMDQARSELLAVSQDPKYARNVAKDDRRCVDAATCILNAAIHEIETAALKGGEHGGA